MSFLVNLIKNKVARFSTDANNNTVLVGVDGELAVSVENQTFNGFFDAAAWAQYGSGTGTVTAGTDATYGTTLELAATVAGAKYSIGRDVSVRRNYPVAFSFLLKKDANLSVFDFEIGFEQYGFTKYIKLNKGVSMLDTGTFQRITVPMGEYDTMANVTGANADDIRCIRISVTPTVGNTTTATIADFKIHGTKRPGKVAFFFDDGRLDTYTRAFPALAAHGWVGSVAQEYLAVGAADRCTLANLQEMYAAGWDIAAHHTVGFTGLSEADQIVAHKGMKSLLMDNDFTRAAHIFVWPGGSRSAATELIAARYWDVMRTVNVFGQSGIPGVLDPVRQNHSYMGQSITLSAAKARYDKVKNLGGSLVFIFHSLVDSLVATEDWLYTDFVDLLDYIDAGGSDVVPISDIWTAKTPVMIR